MLERALSQVCVPDANGGSDLLTRTDREAIRRAWSDGLTVNDLSALIARRLAVAARFLEHGLLAPKDYVVALDKAASGAAAVVQLAQAAAGQGLPSRIEFVFPTDGLATAAGMEGRETVQRPAPGPTGDPLDVEG